MYTQAGAYRTKTYTMYAKRYSQFLISRCINLIMQTLVLHIQMNDRRAPVSAGKQFNFFSQEKKDEKG